jgi:DNA modification methylase
MRDYGCPGQIGLEESLGDYVKSLVNVFSEVRRVLKPSGTLWLNLGDCYSQSNMSPHHGQRADRDQTPNTGFKRNARELRPKNLVGIPWRVAFALQDDGWNLRSDIIWHKPNAMPESVIDRPTKAHEYIFLMSKNEHYYYDQDSIRDDYTGHQQGTLGEHAGQKYALIKNINASTLKHQDNPLGKNKRSVWSIPTQPTSEAHFATYPEELTELCIKAGCPFEGIVLDPFMGSGTTGAVAIRLNRHFIGFELNPEYIKLANKRIFSSSLKLDMFMEKEKVKA